MTGFGTNLGTKWNRPKPLSEFGNGWVCIQSTAADQELHGQCGSVVDVTRSGYVRVRLLTDHGPRSVVVRREDVAPKQRTDHDA